MSFTPVLDPIALSLRVEPQRKAVRAASVALRRLAASDEQLLRALVAIEHAVAADGATRFAAPPTDDLKALLSEVASATGLPSSEIERHLLSQLRQVAAFAQLDGGGLEDNIEAVGSLIRSGRVELFAGS